MIQGKKNILFLSTNDGSDMRITKEVSTLSSSYNVHYLGVGCNKDNNFIRDFTASFTLVPFKRNSPKAIIFQIVYLKRLLNRISFDSFHVVNEQLLIFYLPWLYKKRVVLDIFDSIFLKYNKPNESCLFWKKLIYNRCSTLIVTDESRYNLMPEFIKSKTIIIENFPKKVSIKPKKRVSKTLTILYAGTLNVNRGTLLLEGLLRESMNLRVLTAGWISDEETGIFLRNERVEYLGILSQNEIAKIAMSRCDYIMCCYNPSNINNIYASPNKIYDAIQTEIPVIINSEVLVSKFVKNHKIGVVLDKFNVTQFDILLKLLEDHKGSFHFSNDLKETYVWENVSKKLVEAHFNL